MNWFEKTNKPIIGLAPMHQVSRQDLRIASKKAGADVVFSEMVASEAVIRKIPQACQMMSFSEEERPIIIQIFGSNPRNMAKAASMIEKELSPDGIDINFGCPVQKAEKQGFGSCQLKDIEGSEKILIEIRKVLKRTPLSIKIRIPEKDPVRTLEFVSRMRDAGIDMLTVHGRTPTQKYRGEADWTHAYQIKKQFSDLLVMGSGDIKSARDFIDKIGNLDGALVGRWAKNHTEIFTEIKEAMRKQGLR